MSFRKNIMMSDKKYERIEQAIQKSYPNSCILWIEEIKNLELEVGYAKQKVEIISKRGSCEELELFHGTREQNINIIINEGFDPSLNKTSAYGKGTYFAKNALYSRDYSPPSNEEISYMFLCSVLVGEKNIYGCNKYIDTKYHDNSVDNKHSPTIYVTPYRYGAVPRFVVAFYRNAK
jgi:poly [ADP-ribose] polymerase 7/11/12/13